MNSPSELMNYIINHPSYNEYYDYLDVWKEELEESYLDRAEKISEMFKLCFVGHGDRRVCLYSDNYVIKLPLESCAIDSNPSEACLYEFLRDRHPDYLKYLCPVLEYNELFVVTPYCEEIEDEDECFEALEDLRNKFESIGVRFTDLEKPDQLAMLNGQIVIVDYEDYEFV